MQVVVAENVDNGAEGRESNRTSFQTKDFGSLGRHFATWLLHDARQYLSMFQSLKQRIIWIVGLASVGYPALPPHCECGLVLSTD